MSKHHIRNGAGIVYMADRKTRGHRSLCGKVVEYAATMPFRGEPKDHYCKTCVERLIFKFEKKIDILREYLCQE